MVVSSIGLKTQSTDGLQGLNIRHTLGENNNNRINLKLLSNELTKEQHAGITDIINVVSNKHRSTSSAIYFSIGIPFGTQRIAIDATGSHPSTISVLSDLIFEADITLGIRFDTTAVFNTHTVVEGTFDVRDRKNMVVEFDYTNHSYAIYDVDSLLSLVRSNTKQIA